jgi:hypothetical protein
VLSLHPLPRVWPPVLAPNLFKMFKRATRGVSILKSEDTPIGAPQKPRQDCGPCSSTGSPLTSPSPSAIMRSLGLRFGGSEHVLSQDQAAERRSMRSTDSHRLAQMRRRGGAGVRPWSMELGSRRVSLHPNLPLLASLFHLCESVRICGRDPLLSGISRAATGRRSKLASR